MALSAIYECIILFILTLYGDPTYPRKIVQDVMDFMDHFIRKVYLPALKADVISKLKENNIPIVFDTNKCKTFVFI